MKGGIVINYELKYMFILLTFVLRQKPVQISVKQIDWQKIFRYADYHDVTSLLYHGILGMEKAFTQQQEQELYKKYKKELLLESEYRSAEEAVMWQLEQHHIQALLLSGTERYELYDIKGTGNIDSLEFLVEFGNMRKIPSLMYAMDYEKKEEHGCQGLLFVRSPGIKIRFLKEIPYERRTVQKLFERLLGDKTYVGRLTTEQQYIYNVCSLMEHYLLGDITIRQILDFRLHKEKYGGMMSEYEIEEILKKAHIREFEQCLVKLGSLWFGEGVPPEEALTAIALEEYVLNPGRVDSELDERLLPADRDRLDFYDRDRAEEWRSKKKIWVFPPKDYMKQIFPILEKIPLLLVFCWCVRGFRILKKIVKYNMAEFKTALLEKLKRIRCKGEKEVEKR